MALCLFTLAAPATALAAYDLPYIGEMETYRAKYEDTFVHVARDYNLGFVEMRAANPGVDPWIPGAGKKLILPTRHILPDAPREGVVINLADMRLYAFVNGDAAPDSYSIGIGREGLNTPQGGTTVARKVEGPIWRPTDRMRREDPKLKAVYGPGPDNPMGSHAMYLGWPQYAIHGTNKPFGIGRRSSSGCIRMYPEGILDLYDRIPVGTKVTVVNQPIKAAWIEDRLYIEAQPTVEQANAMEENGEVLEHKLTEDDMVRIIKVAGEYKDKIRWAAVRTAVRERAGYPVEIARRNGAAPDPVPVEDIEAQPVAEVPAVPVPTKEEIKTTLEEVYSGPAPEEKPRQRTVYNEDRNPARTLNP